MSLLRLAELLESLVFTPARNAKLALIERWFATQPDPERGLGLAAMTGGLSFLARRSPRWIAILSHRARTLSCSASPTTMSATWPKPSHSSGRGAPV